MPLEPAVPAARQAHRECLHPARLGLEQREPAGREQALGDPEQQGQAVQAVRARTAQAGAAQEGVPAAQVQPVVQAAAVQAAAVREPAEPGEGPEAVAERAAAANLAFTCRRGSLNLSGPFHQVQSLT